RFATLIFLLAVGIETAPFDYAPFDYAQGAVGKGKRFLLAALVEMTEREALVGLPVGVSPVISTSPSNGRGEILSKHGKE
ncbi:hypothetical protein, partial [Caldithrix abyssi]